MIKRHQTQYYIRLVYITYSKDSNIAGNRVFVDVVLSWRMLFFIYLTYQRLEWLHPSKRLCVYISQLLWKNWRHMTFHKLGLSSYKHWCVYCGDMSRHKHWCVYCGDKSRHKHWCVYCGDKSRHKHWCVYCGDKSRHKH